MPIRCPKCHHERQPWDPEPLDQCPACGIVYEKYRPPAEDEKSTKEKARTPADQTRGSKNAPGAKSAAPPKATLSTAGIRLPDLGDDDEPPIDAPPRTNMFWVLAIPVTLLVMAAAIHFQNPGKLLVWFTGSWTTVTRPDGFHIDLPDKPVRVQAPKTVEADTLFQNVALYRCDTYGMALYFAEIHTRVPAAGMLNRGTRYGADLAAVLLNLNTLTTTEAETDFAGDEALLWEGTELEVDRQPHVVEIMATGKGHALYVVACVYDPTEYHRDDAQRILDSLTFAK